MKQVPQVKSCAVRPLHRCTMAGSAALSIAAAFLACATSLAGVKYWDNPGFRAYDVGDYVQDGLVVNYDGIRNQGPNAGHDTKANTWADSSGNDNWPLNWYSWNVTNTTTKALGWTRLDTSQGYWVGNGFYFNGQAYFAKYSDSANPLVLGPDWTYQFGTTGEFGLQKNNTQYLLIPKPGWDKGSIGLRKQNGGGTPDKSIYGVDTTLNSSRPYFASNDGLIGYVNFIVDWSSTKKEYITEGTAWPTSSGSSRTLSNAPSKSYDWFSLGGFHNHSDPKSVAALEGFTGIIHFFRIYSKALSAEQLAWNRVVDEARFHNRRSALPMTNVVVSVTGIVGIEDDHFYMDEEGYTFSAPTSRTIEGKRYALSGYTLQTWNDSAWGEAVSHGGESSCTLTDASAKVRITWQYDSASGEGLKTYSVGDYVQEGLAVHFDGICNQGESASHSNAATTWVNLGSGGSANDAALTLGTSGGYWTEDGYRFGGNGTKFVVKTAHAWHTNHTVQTLVDAAYADNTASTDGNYVFSAAWNRAAMVVRGGDSTKTVWFHTQGLAHNEMPRVDNQDPERFTYATAIHNGTNGTACVFTGTEPPTSGVISTGFLSYESSMAEFTGTTAIGGWGGNNDRFLVGKVKSFRYYSRVLANDELAQNRKVDEYRFFGRYTVTNVLVQSTYSYLEGYDKCGPYEVDGSYTFVAPATVTAKGIDYACDGYTVETLTDGEWVVTTTGSGNSYLYSTSAGTVRLTWRWKSVKGLRSAADYAFDDLAPGAVLHYDGKLNAGVDSKHSMNATKWVNIGTAGSAYDAIWANVGSLDRGGWTDDGYESKGGGRFVTATSPTHHWSKSYTAQALVDADATDNTHESGNFIFAGGWDTAAMVIRGDCPATANRRKMWFHTQAAEFAQRPLAVVENGKFTYGTAILDGVSGNAVMFTGTKPPTSGTPATGYKHFDTVKSYNSRFFLGSWNSTSASNGADRYLYGTLKSIRYYDRVLTEEELERNRNVDSARYFGVLGVTNVWVETRFGDVAGEPEVLSPTSGAYKVEGSWTFTADQVKDENGDLVDVKGYYIRKFENGAWISLGWREGNSYTYDGSDGKTVRIIWRGPRPGMLFILR